MSYMDRQGWQCQFLEADLKTPLPKRPQFASSDKITALVERNGSLPPVPRNQVCAQTAEAVASLGVDAGLQPIYHPRK